MTVFPPQYHPKRDCHRWCPYGDGKNPINPHTGNPTSYKSPGTLTWATQPSQYSRGVGYSFDPDHPIVGIDFDLYKNVNNLLVPVKALDHVNTLTLCEYGPSYPSKQSFHVFGLATQTTRERIGARKNLFPQLNTENETVHPIELYNGPAYMRVSFRPMNNLTLQPIDQFIHQLLDLNEKYVQSRTPIKAGTYTSTTRPARVHVDPGPTVSLHPELDPSNLAHYRRIRGLAHAQNGQFGEWIDTPNPASWSLKLLHICCVLDRVGLNRKQAYEFLQRTDFVKKSTAATRQETRPEKLDRLMNPKLGAYDVWVEARKSNAVREAKMHVR